jgi:hypothetical protein
LKIRTTSTADQGREPGNVQFQMIPMTNLNGWGFCINCSGMPGAAEKQTATSEWIAKPGDSDEWVYKSKGQK